MSNHLPITSFKRTKIIATIGPSTDSPEKVHELIDRGANGIRLNFSHGSHEERRRQVAWVRQASSKLGKPVAVIQDLQGPKIRLGILEEPLDVATGDKLLFAHQDRQDEDILPIQYDLSGKVKPGHRMLIADGRVTTKVTAVRQGLIHTQVVHGGKLSSRKGINVPDTDFKGDVITDKDRADIKFGLELGVDYIAQSFVQSAADIRRMRTYLKRLDSPAQIIAKIETKGAADRIKSIVAASDGVMVARGDLALETEPESVPILQRLIIGQCRKQGKISIVATQMLASMTDAPQPTRAEVSDVATAVILGVDAVMLSDETATGHFPGEAVDYMKRIIRYTEENSPVEPVFLLPEDHSVQNALASAVMTLAHQVQAVAIVAETASGSTARALATLRPTMPIIMVTHSPTVANQLAIVYGGKSYVRPKAKKAGGAGEKMTTWLKRQKLLQKDDMVIITSGKYPGKIGGTDTIKVRQIK